MMKLNSYPQICYIALLGPRDNTKFTNVPPMSVVNPMLFYLGNLPQGMFQFVYGVEYYEKLKHYGLQLGYDLRMIYPDTPQFSIDRLLELTKDQPRVILLCTDNEQSIQTYNALFSGKIDIDTLCILYEKVEALWTVQCAKAFNKEMVWKWFYEFAINHYEIDKERLPFSVPILQKEVHDKGSVFSPSRVNTQILNSILGNWGYSKELTDEESIKEKAEVSKNALADKDGTVRQDLLIEQIKRIRAIETMVAYNDPDKETIEDQSRAPLVLAVPYTSIDMRKVERSSKMTQEESKMADFAENILGYYYTKNYTVWNNKCFVRTPEELFLFQSIQRAFIEPRMRIFDLVGLLHCSMRFSPYLRLPVMGKNINSELSFVGIKNIEKLATSPSKNKSIRKAMETIGKKIVSEALVPSTVEILQKSVTQIVAMTDLPIEWMMIDGVPLGFSHDVCRIPETPAVGMLSQYVECKFIPFNIPKDILKHTLVIFGNEEDSFVKAQEPVVNLSKVLGFQIRKCLTKEAFFNTIKEIDPLLLIVDTHGGVDEETHQSFLTMGDMVVSGDDVVKSDIHPRIVFLSACNTFTTYNTVSTIANAFFQVGAAAVTTSYMPVLIEPATTLYTRLLNNLNIAATHNVHRNWLAFVSHLMRTSYIQAPIRRAVHKGMKVDIDTLTRLTTESMFFQKRREIYKKLNTNAFTKGLGADYQNIIPHYLMYSTLGRADLIRFETSLKFPDREENK